MKSSVVTALTSGVDIEPSIQAMLQANFSARNEGVYEPLSPQQMEPKLLAFLAAQGLAEARVEGFKRMGGGASKEQFVFDLYAGDKFVRKCVLRMDPLESAVVTDRAKEFGVMRAVVDKLPVPPVLWADLHGEHLGRPALITGFIGGVTKPSNNAGNVSGLGTLISEPFRAGLSQEFLKYLQIMHGISPDFDDGKVFQLPNQDDYQAARWQLNWWVSAWRDDAIEGLPIMGLAERWMRDNLPKTSELVIVHADYRTGNYLFDEQSQKITAILDWELAHIGDYHEDLGWIACHQGKTNDGEVLASGLMPLAELCSRYTAMTGRVVDKQALYFYQVLSVYKCVVICLATSARTAGNKHSHQDILLSWLTAAGYAFVDQLICLLEEA